jgi:hypothetical protein
MIWPGAAPSARSSPVNEGGTGLPIGTELDADAPNNPREIFHSEATRGHKSYLSSLVMSDRQTSYGWVDSTIDFPVKWQAAGGEMFVLENIVLQAQPASLFSIPSDYRKLDPQALLERIKHSDVWAEPPK